MEVNREDLAWAAGFFEGEGSIHRNGNGGSYKISVTQCDKDLLERFQQIVGGFGKLRITNLHSHEKRPVWEWYCCKFEYRFQHIQS